MSKGLGSDAQVSFGDVSGKKPVITLYMRGAVFSQSGKSIPYSGKNGSSTILSLPVPMLYLAFSFSCQLRTSSSDTGAKLPSASGGNCPSCSRTADNLTFRRMVFSNCILSFIWCYRHSAQRFCRIRVPESPYDILTTGEHSAADAFQHPTNYPERLLRATRKESSDRHKLLGADGGCGGQTAPRRGFRGVRQIDSRAMPDVPGVPCVPRSR